MHRNQWVDSEDAFVPASWWKACGHLAYDQYANGSYPPLTHHDQIILGIDAGYKSDCFTIVGVSFDRYNREEGDPPGVIVRYVKAWYPEEYDQFDFEEPFQELKRLCETYDVLQIAYDPYQLYKFATDFNKLGLSWMVEFQQGAERAVGDKLLYDLIRARRLLHFEDPELDDHINNAHKKADGRGLRLIKGESEKNKIDLAVALSMASKRCIELSEPED
jgi:phage terminase large subunit-like protein